VKRPGWRCGSFPLTSLLFSKILRFFLEEMAETNPRRRNVNIDKAEWPVAKINRLIELYEAQPLLYNNRLKEYHNNTLKTDALKAIAASLDVTSKCMSRYIIKHLAE
jgi:hypothetical protein